jgi:hypothetical protein
MKIKTMDFKNRLSGFVGVKNVKFDSDKIFSYDDELLIFSDLKTGFKNSIVVPFNELFGIVGKTKTKILNVKSNNGLKINGKGIKTGINKIDVEFDEIPDIPEEFEELTDELKTAIKNAILTTIPNDDDSDFSLIKFFGGQVMSSDDLSITLIDVKTKLPTALLRARHFKFVDNFYEWAESDDFVFFKSKNDIVYGLRKIEGHPQYNFDGYEEYFDFDGENIQLPNMFDSITTASIFVDEDKNNKNKLVIVEVKNGIIFIKGENEKGYAKTEEKIDTEKNFTFQVNPDSLKTALKLNSEIKLGKDIEIVVKNGKKISIENYSKALIEYENVKLLISLEAEEKKEEKRKENENV